MNLLSILVGGGIGFVLLFFAVVSLREEEKRAMWVALGLAVALPSLYLVVGLLDFSFQPVIAGILLTATGLIFLALVLPLGPPRLKIGTPRARIDERDIMFARWRLVPGSREYEEYYARRPENKQIDDRIRAAPGLFSPDSKLYHHLAIPAADASFSVIEMMHDAAEGAVSAEAASLTPADSTRLVKGLAHHYGACAVGITELADYHIYTHIGRGKGVYGAPIELDHQYAIAVTVEMSYSMLRQAPGAPESMEVSKQYLSAAIIATQLALFIRSIGYPARAHIDGNYQVICPLVARDAGLGEIGRMGLLITPQQGPRVRIAVVTTNLPLLPDRPVRDPSVVDFCRRCLKCAENCPSRSISFDDRQVIDEVERWQINSETCFHYWSVVGTDCGRCVTVCPYSHPDNLLHGLIRQSIRHSAPARWLAIRMDDLFYGRRPSSLDLPHWLR